VCGNAQNGAPNARSMSPGAAPQLLRQRDHLARRRSPPPLSRAPTGGTWSRGSRAIPITTAMKEPLMSKRQHGNREAKKPKQPPALPPKPQSPAAASLAAPGPLKRK
jgi:hypothetical protein